MDPLLIALFIVLFLLSAFFSGTEIALMGLASHRVDSFLKQEKFGSKALKYIKDHNDKLLITILIGNNLVNVYIAALATQISISFAQSSGLEQAFAVGIATGVITLLLLLFGEIAPKSFATKHAGKISLFVAPIYKILMFVMYPIVIIIDAIIKLISGNSLGEASVTDEEIESFIDMGKDSGTLEEHEHEKIKNILEFDETTVEEIMTPRVNIDALSDDMTVGESIEFYIKHTHSRLPVYSDTIDKIEYFVTIRDLLGENKRSKIKNLKLSKALKVPLNQPLDALFETFKHSRKHLAVVLDEYGGVAGLITLEDVIEEIFGEIRDETDKEVDDIKEVGNKSFIVKSTALVEEVLEEYGLELKHIGLDEKEFGGETMSYVITHVLERFPSTGEEITFEKSDLIFKVVNVKDGKIGDIEVNKK